ncbi:uracil-xanthine permease family protein [Prosthecochloris sp. SCSIO W1103]|uniref:uracil-xanthine permease family protein n=1 Tax=Prosthecochloris sp. SCSIO W1103 TaxID=2992244 RepID=UPI00223E715A|nr:solute carrier family 23 protein [Prosthecochloris sp. SCSIO W1103]UZJ38750.1 purine/pyrimidine permease [Prosthecochloris sp. SCSIO W1103]
MTSEKDSALEYAVNEVPPVGHLIVLSIQHVLLMFVSVALPIIFTSQISETSEFGATLVTFSMIAAGLGSIVQSVGIPFIGSGYLCPNVCGPSYFSVSLSAAWMGGLPLMRGMILIAGLIEMALSPVVQKLKRVFPKFIVGLVVAMVGVSVIKMSVTSLFGLEYKGDAIRAEDIVIGMMSLMVMVLSNLWGKGFVKIYCLLIGMIAGWVFAVVLEPKYLHSLIRIAEIPLFALPSAGPEFRHITFDTGLLVPFVIIAVSGSLKSFGNLLAAQKISEPERESVDYVPIRKGLLADGFSTALAGLLGGMAVDTSSSNIGLAGSTKVLSRWISVAAGIIFILLAFCPKLTVALTLMPKPVLGASIIFAGCFMICTGLLEMFAEEWGPRKTFVVGIALMFGLSTAFLPELYARAPELVKMFFTDPLPTTTILAVILHQVLNLDRLFTSLKHTAG